MLAVATVQSRIRQLCSLGEHPALAPSTALLGKDFKSSFYVEYHQHRSLPDPAPGQTASVTLGLPFRRIGNHQGFFLGVGENPPLLRCSGIPSAACPHHWDCLLLGDTA